MMVKKMFIGIVVAFIFTFNTYALDWQRIYTRSSHIMIDEAIDKVKKNATSVEDLAVLGFAYLHKNEPEKARIVFNEILHLSPETFEARWGLAEVMLRTGDIDGGEKATSAILSEHPDFVPARISEAYLKFCRKDYSGVLAVSNKILNDGKDKVGKDAYLRAYLLEAAALGMIANESGETVKYLFAETVLPAFTAAKEFVPKSAEVYLGLGTFFLTTEPCAGGDPDKVVDYLQEAISLSPKLADGYVRLGQFYQARGVNKNFDKFLNKALVLEPENKLAMAVRSKTGHFIVETVK